MLYVCLFMHKNVSMCAYVCVYTCVCVCVWKAEVSRQKVDPLSQRNSSFAASREVWKYISDSGISTVSDLLMMMTTTKMMMMMIISPRFSTANFAKFRGAICEIPRHYYPQIPYIPRPLGVVVLTDNTSKYKEFIVTCNTKTHYIRPLILIIIKKKAYND